MFQVVIYIKSNHEYSQVQVLLSVLCEEYIRVLVVYTVLYML